MTEVQPVVGSPALVAVATFSSRRIHLIACSGDVVLQQLVRPSTGLDSPSNRRSIRDQLAWREHASCRGLRPADGSGTSTDFP